MSIATTPHFFRPSTPNRTFCSTCGEYERHEIHLTVEIPAHVMNELAEMPTDLMPRATEPGRFAYVELRKVHIEVFDGATVNDLRRAQNFLSMLAEQLARSVAPDTVIAP